jgi:hypothetical protein
MRSFRRLSDVVYLAVVICSWTLALYLVVFYPLEVLALLRSVFGGKYGQT